MPTNSKTMSTRYTNDELEQIAREGDTEREREMAVELLEARGEVPEDTFEERHGQTANDARRM